MDHEAPGDVAGGRHVIDEKSIVYDVLDNEVVIVNLDSGAYYILEGTASTIWQLIAAGMSAAGIADALMRLHAGAARPVVESSTAEFLAQLIAESILVPTGTPPPSARPFDGPQPIGAGRPFSPPVLYRYTDMQALIQMDPIREYDETGWPRRRASPPPKP